MRNRLTRAVIATLNFSLSSTKPYSERAGSAPGEPINYRIKEITSRSRLLAQSWWRYAMSKE